MAPEVNEVITFWMTSLEAKEYGLVDEVLLLNPKKKKNA
jgi:ATP-dependent Clp protease protease subunit